MVETNEISQYLNETNEISQYLNDREENKMDRVILRLEDSNTGIARRWMVEGANDLTIYDIINPDIDGRNGDLEDVLNATLDGGGFFNDKEKLWELGYNTNEVINWRQAYGEIIKRLKSAGCSVKRLKDEKV